MNRILLIDTDGALTETFRTTFAVRDGLTSVTLAPEDEAVETLRSAPFDLVYIARPDKIVGIIAESERSRTRPGVVVLSPDASPEDAVEAMRAGALDYRRFPDGRQELREMVRGHSKLHEQRLDAIEEATGFERWTWSMRVQHIVLIMTFSTLAVTGLPLIFPSVFEGIFFFSDSSLLRGLTHRAAGVGMIALSVLHVGQAIFSPGARRELFALLPRVPGDLRETWGNVMFNLGLREERPRAGKYDFVEKFEYFGVVWGTLVMVLTGLILWFADEVLAIVPLWVIDTARVVHRYEAILAILSVAVWHMYTVHLRPGAFPMSKVWIDGRISRHDMLEHHPAEYERLTGRQARRG